VAGGGAAIAADRLGSNDDSQAVVNDAAKQLGVTPSALSTALKKALENRVDEDVAAGRLTKEQGDELKQRIESGDLPLFFGPRGGHFEHFGELDAAASYLGVTEAELRTQLESGKTLAQVAKDRGKSVDGLIQALADSATKRLDGDVAAGRLGGRLPRHDGACPRGPSGPLDACGFDLDRGDVVVLGVLGAAGADACLVSCTGSGRWTWTSPSTGRTRGGSRQSSGSSPSGT